LAAAIGDDDWARPTPCTEWNVREVLAHVVIGNDVYAEILRDEPPPHMTELRHLHDANRLGAEPVAAFRTSADALLAAFRQPGVLERTFTVPVGPVPGMTALHLRLTETLVHGWDLARATGQRVPFSDDLAQQELAFTRAALAAIPPGRSPFGSPQPVVEDASPIDQLAATLGRRVTAAG
jgi:uncharacterized protein (TIGR03086 family)